MMRKLILILAVLSAALALLAAGCASSPSHRVHASAGATKVGVGRSSLGRIVVDGKGLTVYLFEKDKRGRSACYGQCAQYWPPVLSHGSAVAQRGAMQALLGLTRRTDGTEQVTYAGHPVYRYIGDVKPGQTTGQGSVLFGAGWDALAPAGKKIESD